MWVRLSTELPPACLGTVKLGGCVGGGEGCRAGCHGLRVTPPLTLPCHTLLALLNPHAHPPTPHTHTQRRMPPLHNTIHAPHAQVQTGFGRLGRAGGASLPSSLWAFSLYPGCTPDMVTMGKAMGEAFFMLSMHADRFINVLVVLIAKFNFCKWCCDF